MFDEGDVGSELGHFVPDHVEQSSFGRNKVDENGAIVFVQVVDEQGNECLVGYSLTILGGWVDLHGHFRAGYQNLGNHGFELFKIWVGLLAVVWGQDRHDKSLVGAAGVGVDTKYGF